MTSPIAPLLFLPPLRGMKFLPIAAFCLTGCSASQLVQVSDANNGITLEMTYRRPQVVRNYPLAVREAIRGVRTAAIEEATRRARTIGAVSITGGKMSYIFGPALATVHLKSQVYWGSGWTGKVDDPTDLLGEAADKQAGFDRSISAIISTASSAQSATEAAIISENTRAIQVLSRKLVSTTPGGR